MRSVPDHSLAARVGPVHPKVAAAVQPSHFRGGCDECGGGHTVGPNGEGAGHAASCSKRP